jgi:hypothetical protein
MRAPASRGEPSREKSPKAKCDSVPVAEVSQRAAVPLPLLPSREGGVRIRRQTSLEPVSRHSPIHRGMSQIGCIHLMTKPLFPICDVKACW